MMEIEYVDTYTGEGMRDSERGAKGEEMKCYGCGIDDHRFVRADGDVYCIKCAALILKKVHKIIVEE